MQWILLVYIYTSFETHYRPTQSHVCNNNNIFIIHKIRGKTSALTYIIALWKASKGKKPLLLVDMQWEPKNWIVCWLEMGSSLGGSVTEGPSLHAGPFFGFSSTWASGCSLHGFCTAKSLCGSCIAECILYFNIFLYMFEWKEFIIWGMHNFKDSVAWTAWTHLVNQIYSIDTSTGTQTSTLLPIDTKN